MNTIEIVRSELYEFKTEYVPHAHQTCVNCTCVECICAKSRVGNAAKIIIIIKTVDPISQKKLSIEIQIWREMAFRQKCQKFAIKNSYS